MLSARSGSTFDFTIVFLILTETTIIVKDSEFRIQGILEDLKAELNIIFLIIFSLAYYRVTIIVKINLVFLQTTCGNFMLSFQFHGLTMLR